MLPQMRCLRHDDGPSASVEIHLRLPMRNTDLFLLLVASKSGKRGGLVATGWFPILAPVVYLQVNEIAKVCQTDGMFGQPMTRPGSRLVSPALGIVTILSSDLDPFGTERKFGGGGHFRLFCARNMSSQRGKFGNAGACFSMAISDAYSW